MKKYSPWNHTKPRILLKNFFSTQNYGVLATQQDGHPYTTLVAFAATNNHHSLLFVTKSSTSKYSHIKHNPHMSLLIDNRQNNPKDIKHATVATVLGEAREISTLNKKNTQLSISPSIPAWNPF